MSTFNLFLGGDDVGGVFPTTEVSMILDQYVESYTLIDTVGSWKGFKESGYMIILSFPDRTAYEASRTVWRLVEHLKKDLVQEAVGVQQVPDMEIW